MKSSSGINIGNGNNCQKNRKTTTTSFSSSAYINKRATKTNTGLIKSSNVDEDDIKRQEQQLNEFIQPAHSFYTNSISSFQSESVSSKFKFEITPETINNLNQNQINNQRHTRIQWITGHASLHSKPKISSENSSVILTNSSIDLNTATTTKMATNITKEILNVPNVSITEMTSKDFDDEYQRYVDQDYQDEFDQTLKYTSINVVTDDDEIDDNDKDKLFINQASQAIIMEPKLRKKIKSTNHHKKIKSATKRPKQPSATQVTPTTLSSSSPTRTTSQGDLPSATVTKLTTKIEDNNAGKNMITVDTTKARSNLEVVRLCVRELGWKEVIKRLFFFYLLFS
jgi:hypothetical protein